MGGFPKDAVMEELELDLEQEEEAKRIEDVLMAAARVDVRKMARLLASKKNSELLGETEFRLRDIVHHIGAKGIDAALSERKKRGIRGPA
jgi:hypothetical protein